MLEGIKKIFRDAVETDASKKADKEQELRVATCVLLVEAAMADHQLSGEESRKIFEVLKGQFNLSDEGVTELVQIATDEHARATDLWAFTRQINEALSREEKFEVMEMVWRVIYADGTMDKFEDYVAKRLHRLLRIDHPTFIQIKLKVKGEIEN
jgi:uncharacterized tellurite resistance protein B-like protein